MLEGASTNIGLYSSDFSNAVYSLTATSISINVATSPDGTTNADKLVEDSSSGLHRVGQGAISVTSGQVYTFSFFAKANERNELELQRINTSGTVFNSISSTTVDLINGTISVGSNVTSSSIENYGNGWYRISLSLTAIATGSGGLNIGMQKDGQVFYQGDGTSGLFLFGFQAENSSYPTSYIPTSGSSQTRALETCFGAGTSSTFNSTEGTLYAEIAAISNSTSTAVFSINDGTSSNTLYVGFPTSSNVIQAQLVVGGSAQTNMNHTVSDRTIFNKVAVLYQNNNHKMFVNGVEVETDTSGSVPSANTLDRVNFDLGQGSFDFYGKVKDLRVYNEALTDAQLQTLTTL